MSTYIFETNTEWEGGRRGLVRAYRTPELRVSTPVEFQGEPGFWTPELLFVAAAETCLMETYAAFAEWAHLKVAGYRSAAQGRLEKVDGGLRFTEIIINVVVEVETEDEIASAARVMDKAKKGCLVSNSLQTVVRVEPKFAVKTTVAA